jgi:PIN domain nuclease of toxin-antitoxin system
VRFLLDTAAWINAVKEPETVPPHLRQLFASGGEEFGLSDISLWETVLLQQSGRVDLGMPLDDWFRQALAKNIHLLAFTPEAAGELAKLPRTFQKDPADRIIVATARANRLTLITPDPLIRRDAVVPVWYYRFREARRDADPRPQPGPQV